MNVIKRTGKPARTLNCLGGPAQRVLVFGWREPVLQVEAY